MILEDSPDVWGYTIFCDDIRAEVGGKLTYVGTYAGRLFVHADFPVILPKLALGIVYAQRIGAVVLPVQFQIYIPGDADDKPALVIEVPNEISEAAIRDAAAFSETVGAERGFSTVIAPVTLAPFQLTQPGLFRVRAVRGDRLIRLGSMEVLRAPQPANPATSDLKSGH